MLFPKIPAYYILVYIGSICCAPRHSNTNGEVQFSLSFYGTFTAESGNSLEDTGTPSREPDNKVSTEQVQTSFTIKSNAVWSNFTTDKTTTELEQPLLPSELNDQHFKLGIDLDLSLTETLNENDSPDKLISAPGCPFSTPKWGMISHPLNRNFWVHYGNPPKCFLVETQGPCPSGSKFAARRNSSQGICTCSCYFRAPLSPRSPNTKLLADIGNPVFDYHEPFCYTGSEHHTFYQNKCHTLLTQGPCDKTEVLLMDETTNKPTCKPRECPVKEGEYTNQLQNKYSFSFKYNNTCQEYGTKCNNPKDLAKDHYYFLDVKEDSPYPKCVPRPFFPPPPQSYSQGIPQSLQEICAAAGLKYSNFLGTCFSDARRGSNIG